MKSIMKQQISSVVLLLIALGSYTYAESAPNLPVSSQIDTEENSSSNIEILDEFVITTNNNSQNTNPNLKEGEACDDENLDPANLLPDEYQEIPMAETIPCDKVNCEDLKAAKLLKDSYKKIPMAKTTKLRHCRKKKK